MRRSPHLHGNRGNLWPETWMSLGVASCYAHVCTWVCKPTHCCYCCRLHHFCRWWSREDIINLWTQCLVASLYHSCALITYWIITKIHQTFYEIFVWFSQKKSVVCQYVYIIIHINGSNNNRTFPYNAILTVTFLLANIIHQQRHDVACCKLVRAVCNNKAVCLRGRLWGLSYQRPLSTRRSLGSRAEKVSIAAYRTDRAQHCTVCISLAII